MAVTRNQDRNQAPTARTEREPGNAKKTLGFFNLNMATRSGNPIRIEGIRFMEGNKTHQQLHDYLSLAREGDDKFQGEERIAEAQRRLAEVLSKLEISYNPTRTDEESMLDLV